MSKNMFNITEIETGQVIGIGLAKKEVHERIGIGISRIDDYVMDNKVYNDAYLISAEECDSRKDEFSKEWLAVTERLKKYKGLDRIKITTEGEVSRKHDRK